MFRRSKFKGGAGRNNFGRSKKETNRKKHRGRSTWVFLGKNKHDDDDGVMMSGDSSPPPLRVSVPPSPGFDLTDDARPGKTSPTSTSKTLRSSDTEAIEEAVPIIEKTLPAPEPRPKVEKNGPPYDTPNGKKLADDGDDDSCVIKCISFTQQCCECTIL